MADLNDPIRRGDALNVVDECGEAWWNTRDTILSLPAVTVGVKPLIYALHQGSKIGICIGGRWHGWVMVQHPDGYWVSDHLAKQVDPAQSGPDSILAALPQIGGTHE